MDGAAHRKEDAATNEGGEDGCQPDLRAAPPIVSQLNEPEDENHRHEHEDSVVREEAGCGINHGDVARETVDTVEKPFVQPSSSGRGAGAGIA